VVSNEMIVIAKPRKVRITRKVIQNVTEYFADVVP
jgi:hypothetical protein